jgi:intracellular sulfur oxidation DsrE/DsrF family protein
MEIHMSVRKTKSLLLVGGPILCLCMAFLISAAPTPHHRVVVDVTGGTPEDWAGAVNNVENLLTSLGPETAIEVVGRGNGIGLLLRADTHQSDRMKKLAEGGVIFSACQNTMLKKKISKGDLLQFVATVDSGAAEVIRKQEEGWSYLKAAD